MQAILRLELLQMLRSPRARAVLATLALLCALSTAAGGLLVAEHRRLGARDAEATLQRVQDSAVSTATTTAFDLAAWSESFVARGAGWSAALAAGDLAQLPDSAGVKVHEPPSAMPSLAERSPAALLLGTLDLVWVLVLLVPLAAIGLGFDLVARDRERGTLAMILAPARSGAPLLLARGAALYAVLWLGVVPVALAAALLLPLLLGERPSATALLSLALLLSAYLAYVAAGVLAASALAERAATALSVGLGAFLLLHLALPLAASALARAAFPAPDPRGALEAELAAQEVFQKPSAEILDREAERDPELDPARAVDGVSSQNRYFMLLSSERYRRAEAARFEEQRVLERRAQWAELSAWSSPATLLAWAMSALGDGGLAARAGFLADAERYRAELSRFVRGRVVDNERRFAHPEQWPRFSAEPRAGGGAAVMAGAALLALAAAMVVLTLLRFQQGELAPTRGDG